MLNKIIYGIVIVFIFLGCSASDNLTPEINIVKSVDKTPITYATYGKGKTALLFVHGWSCDSRYWRFQVPEFSKNYTVVTIDLAGHGHSGYNRNTYTFQSYADDVLAVVNALDAEKVIIIGHSMSGYIMAKAAVSGPDKMAGLIGVDTLQSLEDKGNPERTAKFISGMKSDFSGFTQKFVHSMLRDNLDDHNKNMIALDMASAPAHSATETIENYFADFSSGEVAKIFDQLEIPVYCINTTLWPTDIEANKKHIKNYKVVFMEGVGHFPMLEAPAEFNKHLKKLVDDIVK